MSDATNGASATPAARDRDQAGDGAPKGRAPLLEARNVHKTYRLGRTKAHVLRGVDIEIQSGEWVAILGASGSGKSTLLHLLGGLDRPDRNSGESETGKGVVKFDGRPLHQFRGGSLNRYRARSVGFVFQAFHLLPELTALENVLLASMAANGRVGYLRGRKALRERARDLLERVGLGHRLKHRPVELSGGERQRVAIARAVMNRPRVLLADEPTGNLDQATGEVVLDALAGLREGEGTATVLVTHDPQVARRADRVLRLLDGRMETDG